MQWGEATCQASDVATEAAIGADEQAEAAACLVLELSVLALASPSKMIM